MIYYAVFSWCITGVAVLALAIAALGLFRIARRRKRYPEPRCGKCGYIVIRLSNERCPECGANFAEVGVLLPGAGGNNGLRIFGWSIFCVVLAVAGSQVNLVFANCSEDTYFQTLSRGTQDVAVVRAQAHIWNGSGILDTLSCRFAQPARGSLEWLASSRQWRVRDSAGNDRMVSDISSADIDICRGALELTASEVYRLRDYFHDIVTAPDPRYLHVHRLARPPGIPWNEPYVEAHANGYTGSSNDICSSDFASWICVAVWGIFLPIVGTGKQRRVIGREAQLYLRVEKILEKATSV